MKVLFLLKFFASQKSFRLTRVSQMGKSLFGVTVPSQALCKSKVSWQHGDNHSTDNGVVACKSVYEKG